MPTAVGLVKKRCAAITAVMYRSAPTIGIA
jgi:hypothetical protein